MFKLISYGGLQERLQNKTLKNDLDRQEVR